MAATPEQRKAFGQRLKELRTARGWSQPQLVAAVVEAGGDQVSPAAVSEYERGVSAPSVDYTRVLEEVFDGEPLRELLGYRGDDPTVRAEIVELRDRFTQLEARVDEILKLLQRRGGQGSR